MVSERCGQRLVVLADDCPGESSMNLWTASARGVCARAIGPFLTSCALTCADAATSKSGSGDRFDVMRSCRTTCADVFGA